MKGLFLTYSASDNISRTQFNQKLFGSFNTQKHRGKKYIYYRPGILHAVPFYRLGKASYFVVLGYGDEGALDRLSNLSTYCNSFDIIPGNLSIDMERLNTAHQYWQSKAEVGEQKVKNL